MILNNYSSKLDPFTRNADSKVLSASRILINTITIAMVCGHWYFGDGARQQQSNQAGTFRDLECSTLYKVVLKALCNKCLPTKFFTCLISEKKSMGHKIGYNLAMMAFTHMLKGKLVIVVCRI